MAGERSNLPQCRKAVVVEAGLDNRDVLIFLAPVKPGALAKLVGLEEEGAGRDVNAAHRIDVTCVHVVKPKPIPTKEFQVLTRIELWLKPSNNKITRKRMRARVKHIKALVKLWSAIPPKAHPLTIRAVVEVIAHANVSRTRRFLPKRCEVGVIAGKATREVAVKAGFAVLHSANGYACWNLVGRSFATDPVFGLDCLFARPKSGRLSRSQIKHQRIRGLECQLPINRAVDDQPVLKMAVVRELTG